jgi:hypothetical protein
MLKRLVILVVIEASATIGIYALAAQAPPARAPEKGIAKSSGSEKRPQSEHANDNAQSPEKPPTVVVQVAAPEANTDDPNAKENLEIQRQLGAATVGLVIVGLFQVIIVGWQAVLLNGTLEAIKKQSEIANRTLEAQFRPKVIVRRIDVTKDNEDSPWNIEIHVENVGGTIAFVQESAFEIRWKVAVDPPHNPRKILQIGSIEPFSLEAGGEHIASITVADSSQFTSKISMIHLGIRDGKPSMWSIRLAAVIRYKYGSGTVARKTGICRRLAVETSSFVGVDDSEEEYQD